MPPLPDIRHAQLVIASALTTVLLVYFAMTTDAHAALRSAAGGGDEKGGGFARFVTFIDRLADYTIPVGAAFSVLGLMWGGLQFVAGDARAAKNLGLVAVGVGILLMAKPLAA